MLELCLSLQAVWPPQVLQRQLLKALRRAAFTDMARVGTQSRWVNTLICETRVLSPGRQEKGSGV